jgi:hypothetical protein
MKQWLFYPIASAVVTAALHWLLGIQIGFSALIAFLGWPILGAVVTADDDLPGGFNNPHGKATPAWETAAFWGSLFGGCAVVCLAFLVQVGFALYFLPAAAVFALASAILLYRAHDSSPHAG